MPSNARKAKRLHALRPRKKSAGWSLSFASAALLPTLIFAGCATDKAFVEQARTLPSADELMLDFRAEPDPAKKDLALIAQDYRDWGRENTYRGVVNTCAYADVVVQYATGDASQRSRAPVCERLRKERAGR